jgi:hypothetical protein
MVNGRRLLPELDRRPFNMGYPGGNGHSDIGTLETCTAR